jgi:hypothetical protein
LNKTIVIFTRFIAAHLLSNHGRKERFHSYPIGLITMAWLEAIGLEDVHYSILSSYYHRLHMCQGDALVHLKCYQSTIVSSKDNVTVGADDVRKR